MLQRTEQWFQDRVGRATASRISDVIARIKSGYGASRENYLFELVVERITQRPYPRTFVTAAMQWGIDHEQQARATYAFQRDCNVEECGFIAHPTIEFAGASPDGLVGNDGLVEIKCPDTKAHMKALKAAKLDSGPVIDSDYLVQMQFQLACCPERQWVDYVSYDPRAPKQMQLLIVRVDRLLHAVAIAKLELEVIKFLSEVAAEEQWYRQQYPSETV